MYSANLTIDLESPYQNAARREERYQVIVESQQEDIFSALTDEQEAESFISDFIADPTELLGYVIQQVALTHEKLEGMKRRLCAATSDVALSIHASESLKIKHDAYHRIFDRVLQEIERVAELKAQSIYA